MGQHFDTRALALAHLVKNGFRYLRDLQVWEKTGQDEDGDFAIRASIHPVAPGHPVVLCAVWEVEPA